MLIFLSTTLRMRNLILILILVMIVALILTPSSSLLMIHRLAQILGRMMKCSWYGLKQAPKLAPKGKHVQLFKMKRKVGKGFYSVPVDGQ